MQVKATSIKQSFLRSTNYVDGEDIEQIDSFMAIATSDTTDPNQQEGGMDLILMHFQKAQSGSRGSSNDFQYVSKQTHSVLHSMDITQIVILTDYENRLQFVTCSLDCTVKILEIDLDSAQSESGKFKSFSSKITYEILAQGSIYNALCLRGPTGVFALSSYNEETDENYVQIFRRKTERGSFGPFEVNILDFILIDDDRICLPDPEQYATKLAVCRF